MKTLEKVEEVLVLEELQVLEEVQVLKEVQDGCSTWTRSLSGSSSLAVLQVVILGIAVQVFPLPRKSLPNLWMESTLPAVSKKQRTFYWTHLTLDTHFELLPLGKTFRSLKSGTNIMRNRFCFLYAISRC